ncbi:hypothetical protein [Haemophilus parahaemolyticus]|uniref:hypothetical protein n=1 Tax=Haemophilus parahaemolyticus TaxID=735 RepID=UPI001403740B|nr:hypothetical protein [Haemophilus parahaemolyticus]
MIGFSVIEYSDEHTMMNVNEITYESWILSILFAKHDKITTHTVSMIASNKH